MPKPPSHLVPAMPITLTHETDLAYATDAISRVLPDWAQETLRLAAQGVEVSAWDLHCALDQALSAAATRHGQSMMRREMAKKVRHLVYKCDAVIENHLAGLEPMEPGARSPRIAELEQALAVEQERTTALIKEKTAAEIDVENLRGFLRNEADSWERLHALYVEQVRATEYARSLLDEVGKARVDGYRDGAREAR